MPLVTVVQLQEASNTHQWCRNLRCLSAAAALEPLDSDWQPTCTGVRREADWEFCLEVRSECLHELQYHLCKTMTATTSGIALRKAHTQWLMWRLVVGGRLVPC